MPNAKDLANKAREAASAHDNSIDQAVGKVGETAKSKISGHDDAIDQAVAKAKDATGNDDR